MIDKKDPPGSDTARPFRPLMGSERVAAVVVAYRDREAVRRCLGALAMQTRPVDEIIVIDNSEEPILSPDDLHDVGTTVVRPGRNVGIAEALNLGFRRAIEVGLDFCWTFDQDSEPLPNALEEILYALQGLEPGVRQKVGIIASTGISRRDGRLFRGNPARWLPGGGTRGDLRRTVYDCDVVITAGCLTNAAAVMSLGGARADYFIDWVDFELTVRLRRSGYRVMSCQTSFYIHQIGGDQGYAGSGPDRRLLGGLRAYTKARNSIDTVLRRSWGVRRFPYLAVLAGKLAAEARRSGTMRPALIGMYDGLRGRNFGVEETLRRVRSLSG